MEEIRTRWSKVADKPSFSVAQAKQDIFKLLSEIENRDRQIAELRDKILLRKNQESYVAKEIKQVFDKYDVTI